MARREGFEPPAFWSVVSKLLSGIVFHCSTMYWKYSSFGGFGCAVVKNHNSTFYIVVEFLLNSNDRAGEQSLALILFPSIGLQTSHKAGGRLNILAGQYPRKNFTRNILSALLG